VVDSIGRTGWTAETSIAATIRAATRRFAPASDTLVEGLKGSNLAPNVQAIRAQHTEACITHGGVKGAVSFCAVVDSVVVVRWIVELEQLSIMVFFNLQRQRAIVQICSRMHREH